MPPWPRPDRPWKLPRRWKKSRLPWLQPREAIQAAGELVCASDLFRDVSLDAWYHKGVDFCGPEQLHGRHGQRCLWLNAAITRGQIVTILYRMEGEPV